MSALSPGSDDFDHFYLSGAPNPGIATLVSGLERVATYDEAKGAGASGATLSYTGENLADITFEITLWTDLHFLEWDAFSLYLKPPLIVGAAKPIAMQLYHPQIDELGISAVVFISRTPLEQDDTRKWKCIVKFKEYRGAKAQPILGDATVNGTIDMPRSNDGFGPYGDPGDSPDADTERMRAELHRSEKIDAETE